MCAFDKVAAEQHYFVNPKADTDPKLIHRVFDSILAPLSIHHYCGHFTVYVSNPEDARE